MGSNLPGPQSAERQGHRARFLPVRAPFVLDRQGVVRWCFVDIDLA